MNLARPGLTAAAILLVLASCAPVDEEEPGTDPTDDPASETPSASESATEEEPSTEPEQECGPDSPACPAPITTVSTPRTSGVALTASEHRLDTGSSAARAVTRVAATLS